MPPTFADSFQHDRTGSGVQVALATAVYVNPSAGQEINSFYESVRKGVAKLRSSRQLELYAEPATAAGPDRSTDSADTTPPSSSVFIVHGHDEAAKQDVARFLERLGLEVIILHERPDKGRTVIDKFEQNADVGYTIALLTADDIGGTNQSLRP